MQEMVLRAKRIFSMTNTLILGSVLVASSGFAAVPVSSDLAAINAEDVSPVRLSVFNQVRAQDTSPSLRLWQQQADLNRSLEQSGLVPADLAESHQHDSLAGVGGDFDPDDAEPVSRSDRISDTIDQIADQAARRESGLQSLNQSMTANPDSKLQLRDILAVEPVANAKVTSPYGYRTLGGREFHPGIDLAAPYGTSIYATGTGVVVYAGWKNGYGNFVEIDHGNGYVTRYGHSSRILVSVGDHVKKDQEIARVGCSGRCTGPHLHYEVLYNGVRQNPATYLALAPRREE